MQGVFQIFWKRWHISFSNWLRDYIYLPLARDLIRRGYKRDHALVIVVPLVVTFAFSGLWHGLSLHMLVWGLMHSVYLIAERLVRIWHGGSKEKQTSRGVHLLGILTVFFFATLARVAFRVPSVRIMPDYYMAVITGDFNTLPDMRVIGFIAITLGIDGILYRSGDENSPLRWHPILQAFLLAVIFLLILAVVSTTSSKPFIYQSF